MKTDSLLGWGFFPPKMNVCNNRTELYRAVQNHTSYPTTRNSGELIELDIQSVALKTPKSSCGVLLM